MRKITKLMLTLMLLATGAVGMNAQEDEVIDFDASFYHSWSEVSATATDNGVVSGGVCKIGEEVALGGTFWGDGSGAVPYLNYANITEYSELRIEGTPGAVLRLMCNRLVNEGPIYEIKPTIPENGKLTISISDLKFTKDENGTKACDFVCLQSIKVPANWQGGTTAATITSIKIVKPSDPLANYKTDLKNALNSAELKNSYGKTEASWTTLTEAIAAGKNALNEDNATAETLSEATKALNNAISGLQLTVGYTMLTQGMFQTHTAQGEAGTGQAGCAYVLNQSTGMPYGDGSVGWLNYADLTAYDKLIVVATAGTPRFCMNRTADNAQDNDDPATSQFIDIPGHAWGTEAYQTKDGDNVWVIDLKKLVADRGIAYLHSIKGANYASVTVTDMLLYKDMSYAIVGDLTGGWEDDVEMTATENEGEYTLTVENVVVGSTEAYKYKLRANGNWNDYQLPAGSDNALWTPEEGIGYYTLTFTANVLNHTLNCVGEKTADFEYAVVGCTYEGNNEVQSELFAGSKAWDTNTTDIMTKQNDGTYVWEKKEVVLPAKWIDLKVVARDGENVIKWYGNENGANVGLNINETGEAIYNVTVTFNGSNVTATAERVPTATIYFVNDSDWPAENIKVYVWKDNVNNGWPGEKMSATGEQIDGKDVYSWNSYSIDLPSNIIISNDGSKTERTGNQPFVDGATYRPDGSSTVSKTIGTAGYATFYCASALDFSNSGLTAYVATIADGKVSFSPVTSVPANTGVLLKGEAGDYTINTTTSADQVTSAMLGVLKDTEIAAPIYVLMNGDNGVGFYETTVAFTVGANTAYLPATAGARSFIAIDTDNTVTAIEGINAEKALNGEVYNLQGQRVMKAQKGLYIVDGKMIIVK